MSYDLFIFDAEPNITADEAAKLYHKACDVEEPSISNEKINAFTKEITRHYPQIDDYSEDKVDDCPWNIAFSMTETSVVMCISFSRLEEVAPLLIELVAKHELVCYDPQEQRIWRPEILS